SATRGCAGRAGAPVAAGPGAGRAAAAEAAAWAAAWAARARSSRARCSSCSCLRACSSRTAVFSCAISAWMRWTVSGSSVLMWFFTSTPRRRTIWSTASLDMPSSLATSYTRGFFSAADLAMALPLGGRCGFLRRLGRSGARRRVGCRLHLGRELHLAARRIRADRRMRIEVLLRGGHHLLRGLVPDARDLDQLLERRGEQLLHRLDP